MARKTFELRGNLTMLCAEHGIDISTFIERYQLTRNSIWAAMNPQNYPGRSGRVNESTAWKVVHAYRSLVRESTGRELSPADAWQIVVEGADTVGNKINERAVAA